MADIAAAGRYSWALSKDLGLVNKTKETVNSTIS
jgi:hypothetical protein